MNVYAGKVMYNSDWRRESVNGREYPSPDHSVPVPQTRTVDAGMWCSKCGTVVQCHVEGPDAEALEEAVRSYYPQKNDRPTLCVCAGQHAVVIIDNGGIPCGLGAGWDWVRRYWQEHA